MSYADRVFKYMCRSIIDTGCDTKGEIVRPTWSDGEKAYTIKKFGVVNRYNLRSEFPALTLRKTALKSAMDEILWIYQKNSNNIHDLNSHIWDEWADETGSIGKAYGYQVGKKYIHHKMELKDLPVKEYEYKMYPSIETKLSEDRKYADVYMSQIDAVIYDLKHNPFSRRIMMNLYNFEDLHEMNLYPCAYSVTFNCTKIDGEEKLVLNMVLNQRSQDVLAANNWNVCQYSILLMMIAQVCDMIPGEFVHVISDCHIYDRHIPIIEELISRDEYAAPKVWLDPEVKNFYDFTTSSLHVENYSTGPQIKNIPIAI